MPSLRELQCSFAGALCAVDLAALDLPAGAAASLDIYRNTRRSTLVRALELSFPAVRRLVGEQFFAAVAGEFVAAAPPTSAYLNAYGGGFPDFLASYAPARGLIYLADVARLEWAVNQALHAPDAARLDVGRLAALPAEGLARVAFGAHPSVTTLRLDHPADAIWRAVLQADEAALRSLDPAAGPVRLLVERDGEDAVQVRRLSEASWRLTARLCAGEPLCMALEPDPAAPAEPPTEASAAVLAAEAQSVLTEHLLRGRFVDFYLNEEESS